MPYSLQILFAALLGLSFGSFGTMLLDRLPRGESFMGRSRCPHCGETILPHDLIPVVSFLLLQGKCRNCRKRIPWRYPSLEACTALIFALLLFTFQGQPFLLLFLGTASMMLLLIAFYDFASERIPDAFVAMLFLSALGAATYHSLIDPTALRDSFAGAAIPFLFFGFLFVAGNVWSRRGPAPRSPEGEVGWIGSGDVLLGTSIGLLLGVAETVLTLFLAYVFGAVIASVLILTGRVGGARTIAFGPFLSVGTLIALLFGETLIAQYQKLLL